MQKNLSYKPGIGTMIKSLEVYSEERKKARRFLFKYLRTYRNVISDPWLLRKMNGRWLGDLTDNKLLYYCKEVRKSLGEEI